MAFPITGSTATVTSVTAGTDVKFLFDVLKINEVAINTEADEFDISELSGSGAAVERLSGLRSGTMTFSGFYPKAAPKIGNTGLLQYGSTPVTVGFVQDWTMDIDFGEIDITSFNATAPTVKKFMPSGLFTWGGTFNVHMLNEDNALGSASDDEVTLPTAAGSTGTAAIFQIFTGATNAHTLSGNVLLRSLGHSIRKADKQVLAYAYSGSGGVTEQQGDTYDPLRIDPASIAPGGSAAWTGPSWTDNTSPSIVVTAYSGRTYTIKAFLKSLSISVSPGNPIAINGSLRIFDTITTA
jgi:hypothetical protein